MTSFTCLQRIAQSLLCAAVFQVGVKVAFADWPGLLGPSRNGNADPSASLPSTLTSTPRLAWKLEAGQGYAGAAIAGNDVVLYERNGNVDSVRLVDFESGEQRWKQDIPAAYRGGIDSDKGPRCVPSILPESVLVYSAAGELTLLARKDGRVLWTRAIRKELAADDGYFGAGSTPVIFEGNAIVNVGAKAVSVVCISLRDGSTVWSAGAGEASYSSPILVSKAENNRLAKTICIVPTRLKTIALDPANGRELWQVPFGQRGPTVNAATPIVLPNGNLFMTASYGIGCATIEFDEQTAKIVRTSSELSSQYASPIVAGGMVFGSDGREDSGSASIKCLSLESGKTLWEQDGLPISHVIGVSDKLLFVGINGKIFTQSVASKQFKPEWSADLGKGVFRALPAYSQNRLCLRSSNGPNDAWYCFELR
jgi:outer membrane protein assembly factor BamB